MKNEIVKNEKVIAKAAATAHEVDCFESASTAREVDCFESASTAHEVECFEPASTAHEAAYEVTGSSAGAPAVVATKADQRWAFWMEFFGRHFRCHQMPERSFFIRGYQFPLCARCTGIYLGHILAFLVNPFITLPFWLGLLMLPMIADGTIQYFTSYRSNNFKRFTSGLVFGFALVSFVFTCVRWLITVI